MYSNLIWSLIYQRALITVIAANANGLTANGSIANGLTANGSITNGSTTNGSTTKSKLLISQELGLYSARRILVELRRKVK